MRPRSADSHRSSSLRPLTPHLNVEHPSSLRRKGSKASLSSTCASEDEGRIAKRRESTGEIPDVRRPLDAAQTSVPPLEQTPPHRNVVQIVTYSSRMVDNVSEIVEALNISSSASIKYGTVKAAGSASFINENKIESSDLNYVVTVKVTNETSPVADKVTFNPIPELEPSKFTEVFGKHWRSAHRLYQVLT